MAINTGNFPKALLPAVTKHVMEAYKDYPSIIPELFEMDSSDRSFEERTMSAGLGLAREQKQGTANSYDDMQEVYTKRFVHVRYTNGFIVTEDMLDDDQAGVVIKMKAPELKKSYLDTREVEGANVINNAFNSSYAGGDGKELCNSAHPTLGGTNSNILTVATDFSEAGVEAMINQMIDWTNLRGLRQMVSPDRLVCHPSLRFEVKRLLGGDERPGTSDRDVNAIRKLGYLQSDAIMSPYFTDTDAWFITTDVPNGLMYFDRKPMEVQNDNDFDTRNAKFIITGRFGLGWVNPLAIIGTPGA